MGLQKARNWAALLLKEPIPYPDEAGVRNKCTGKIRAGSNLIAEDLFGNGERGGAGLAPEVKSKRTIHDVTQMLLR